MLIEYDGTDFNGWQRQPDTTTIQSELEFALSTAARQSVSVVGSGRTDSGVHARGQVAHVDLDVDVDTASLVASVNALTPRSIAVKKIEACPGSFHARYDAYRRRYGYYVSTTYIALERLYRARIKGEIDFELMNEAARRLIGRADYSCFCITQSETTNRICDIQEAEWVAGPREGEWDFRIAADRFLHGMVRAIVGTLFEIGQNRRSVSDLVRTIDSRDRRMAGPSASACGLVLEEVSYRIDA